MTESPLGTSIEEALLTVPLCEQAVCALLPGRGAGPVEHA